MRRCDCVCTRSASAIKKVDDRELTYEEGGGVRREGATERNEAHTSWSEARGLWRDKMEMEDEQRTASEEEARGGSCEPHCCPHVVGRKRPLRFRAMCCANIRVNLVLPSCLLAQIPVLHVHSCLPCCLVSICCSSRAVTSCLSVSRSSCLLDLSP